MCAKNQSGTDVLEAYAGRDFNMSISPDCTSIIKYWENVSLLAHVVLVSCEYIDLHQIRFFLALQHKRGSNRIFRPSQHA